MKTKHIFIASGLIVLGGVWLANKTNALTYQDTADVQFTFDPSLSLTLSGTSLTISDLTPGNYKESTPITITVATNSVAGYKLSASVGNSTAPRNGTNLVHSTITSGNNSAAANKFTSLATNANVALASITAGSWGYAIGSGNYSGLPAYSATPKDISTKNTMSANGGDAVSFKVGAKAPADMLSGDYSNVINFQAVTNVVSN